MDGFNDAVRRLANLIAYEQPIPSDTDRWLLVCAQLYNSYAPFPMPNEPKRFRHEVSGEFTAR